MKIKLTIFNILFFFVYAVAQNDPVSNNTETEKLLCKKWILVSDAVCDRCFDYFPKDTLTVNFYRDKSCKGAIVGQDTTTKGQWQLISNKLIIDYTNNFRQISKKEYKICEITDTTLILCQELWGGTFRKFKTF